MIEASFEQATHKSAAIGGIYQYDTGQRLRMHGLPTPEELAEMDDFLVGDAVTVQAQYGYIGDSQTETRLAAFDAQTGCWEAEIPDAYLTRSSAVKVFVYVSYGATEDECGRRPATRGVSPDQPPCAGVSGHAEPGERVGRAGGGNQPDALEDEHGDFGDERGGGERAGGDEGGEHADGSPIEDDGAGRDTQLRERKHGDADRRRDKEGADAGA